MTTPPPITTRPPTGLPPWPIMLLAGAEKAGKSYACAEASASDLIGRTLWVSIGEDDPDELGALPGVRFEIVEHDGLFRGIHTALVAAAAQPRVDGKPNLIVMDSGTRLWDLLSGMAQVEANRRAAVKAAKYNKPVGDEDTPIGMDLWNTAKDRWAACMDALRGHDGPSIVTARLEQATVMNEKGEPTKDRMWKVKAEKSLPYDVGVTVELPKRGDAHLAGVRSLRFRSDKPSTPYPDFTVEKLWTDLGMAEAGGTAPRQHATNRPAGAANPNRALINDIARLADDVPGGRAQVAQDWAEAHDGQSITEATDVGGLELFRDDLQARAQMQIAS